MTEATWPEADFDAVRSLHVIATVIPGSTIHEVVLDAPFTSVWTVASDLEGQLAQWLFPDIRSVHVTPTGEARSVAHVRGHSGLSARFDVVLRPGWCLMQSRYLVGGMAATPEAEDSTRFAFLGGFRGPLRVLDPVTRLLSGWNGQRALERLAGRVDDHHRRRSV